jgi:Fe2+ transport system protein B
VKQNDGPTREPLLGDQRDLAVAGELGEWPMEPPAGGFRHDLRRGIRSGLGTFWMLTRTMVPAYGAALILERIGAIDLLARVAQPVMSLLGLPGKAALPLVLGYILNVYAAVGAIQALHLTSREVTVLAMAILISHNLLVEGAVLRRTGMSGTGFAALRIVAGLVAAAILNLLMGVV